MTRAAIDIGSNSLLLTVVDDARDKVLVDQATVVGLGREVGENGELAKDRMDFAVAVLAEYVRIAGVLGVPAEKILTGATSACRRASNRSAFIERVRIETGIIVRVLTGEEEAQYTARGGLSDLWVGDDPVVVIDPGGGSTEFALVHKGELLKTQSAEIGSVRLMDEALGWGVATPTQVDTARRVAETAMAPITIAAEALDVVGVAGTVTSLAALDLDLLSWNPDSLHGFRLTRRSIQEWIEKLAPLDVKGRRAILPASPNRAETILAGAIVLDTAMGLTGIDHLVTSVRGLRFGLLLECYDAN